MYQSVSDARSPQNKQQKKSSPSSKSQAVLQQISQSSNGHNSSLNSYEASNNSSIKRTESEVNLTTPALYSFFDESDISNDENINVNSELISQLDFITGAPIKSNPERKKGKSFSFPQTHHQGQNPISSPLSIKKIFKLVGFYISRFAILFLVGIAYTAFANNIHDNHFLTPQFLTHPLTLSSYSTLSLPIWLFAGLEGIVLGSLLPIFDYLIGQQFTTSNLDGKAGNDFSSILRASCAFLGIGYGIRKIDWTSSIQAALSWALLNPCLWFIIDGTFSGLVFCGVISSAFTFFIGQIDRENFTLLNGEEIWVVYVWICSFFFCGLIIFGNLGRLLFKSNKN